MDCYIAVVGFLIVIALVLCVGAYVFERLSYYIDLAKEVKLQPYWYCTETGTEYTPSEGERARLYYWGVSGACSCSVCRG